MPEFICVNSRCTHYGKPVANTGCVCGNWCDCHKPGWPEDEVCDCRPACEFCALPAMKVTADV